jgi:GH24 family phage-related lysozyme (muramidase)
MTKTNKYLLIGAIVLIITMSSTSVYASLATFLKKYEEDNKAALEAYNDGFGTWTIGWGSIYNYDLKRAVQPGDIIDQATADRWLAIEAKSKMDAVKKLVTVTINNNQLIALGSFAYNLGIGALSSSTLLKLLNQGADKVIVANQFDRWVNANGVRSQGLVNRRNAEKALFLS